MKPLYISLPFLFALFPKYLGAVLTDQYCKPQAGDRHWPAQSAWQSLNASVSGGLYVPVPPGAVCHPAWPQYDNATCKDVTQNWAKTGFHALDPISVDYNDETCLPSPEAPCSLAGYPSYVIEAENARDVQHAVKFAHETGVRLVVKGTGHDFPGRYVPVTPIQRPLLTLEDLLDQTRCPYTLTNSEG